MSQNEFANQTIERYSHLSIGEIVEELHINLDGYESEEVIKQRKRYGDNAHLFQRQDTILYCIQRAFVNPFSTILFILGIISFVTDVLLPNAYHKSLTTVVIIFSMLILSGVVRFIQEIRSRKVVHELTKMVHTTVRVLRKGIWQELPSSELVVGDEVSLEAGDRVPADLRITSAMELFVSQSIITGESGVCEKTEDTLVESAGTLTDYSNILFCGSTLTGGTAEGIVIAVGSETIYGGFNIRESDRKHGFDHGANEIARVLIRFMMILVPIVFITSGLTKGDWLEAFLFALSVAVGLTPELLPMVVSACLAKGSHSMGKKQTIVKNINAMQGFGSMDILCVDKTGTLTGDQVILEYYMNILGRECQKTLDYGYLASIYHTGVSNHLDEAIRKVQYMPGREDYYQNLVESHPKMDEHPFDYTRRYASVLVEHADENLMIIKGSIDEVAGRCGYVEYDGETFAIEEDPSTQVHAVVDEMLEEGMKVIAVAYKKVRPDLVYKEENDYILLGFLAFFDAPKQSAAGIVEALHEMNLEVKVATGDHLLVTQSVCRRLGIPTERCITGKELERVPENDLPVIIEKSNVFAELSPKQKAYIVETLQNNGHTVGFLGDGMNDLPAVMKADVGISVENATEAVKECADVILLKKDLNVLREGVLEGRKAFANMSKYIKITASSNFGNICAIVVASVLLPFFPMTSIQLLLLNLLYDILCLVLPWDHVDEDLITKPLEWSGRKLSGFMTFFGPISSIFDLVTFAFLFFVLCPKVCGASFAQLDLSRQAVFIAIFQTGWFLESMWSQVLILQLLRTEKIPFVQSRPGRMVVTVTIMGIILFTLLPMTGLGQMLGLCGLPVFYYMFLVSVVMLYLLVVTFAKGLYVKKNNKLI